MGFSYYCKDAYASCGVSFNMVYCSSTIHVPHTVQQNRHHRYRKNLHMFILMCVQQKEINRPFILLKKKKKDLQNAMRKCWQSGSVTLCYTHTHTDTSCCFHQAPVRHNSYSGTCSLRTKNSLLHGVRPRLKSTPAER